MLGSVSLHRQEAGVHTEVTSGHLRLIARQGRAGATTQMMNRNTVNPTSTSYNLVMMMVVRLIVIRVIECDTLNVITGHFTSRSGRWCFVSQPDTEISKIKSNFNKIWSRKKLKKKERNDYMDGNVTLVPPTRSHFMNTRTAATENTR